MLKHVSKLAGVNPILIQIVQDAAEICPVDISVVEGIRTIQRQRELVAAGRSKTMSSYHLTGHAVDLWDGKSWEKAAFRPIIAAMEAAAKARGVEITGGYAWGWDFPHWQIKR